MRTCVQIFKATVASMCLIAGATRDCERLIDYVGVDPSAGFGSGLDGRTFNSDSSLKRVNGHTHARTLRTRHVQIGRYGRWLNGSVFCRHNCDRSTRIYSLTCADIPAYFRHFRELNKYDKKRLFSTGGCYSLLLKYCPQ